MIKENYVNIEKKIKEICNKYDRDSRGIKVVAVSKFNPIEAVKEAYTNGIHDFGESRAQELKEKYDELKVGYKNIVWHFIGHLQTNKVKSVVEAANYIHSVDSLRLAKEIQKRAEAIDKIQNIFLEIKTSEEESKFGIESSEDFWQLAEYCFNASNINLVGLMTMAPFTEDENLIRNSFKKAKKYFKQLNEKGFSLTELSMGMTNDYGIAIEEGATFLRIGTAIFGNRNYNN